MALEQPSRAVLDILRNYGGDIGTAVIPPIDVRIAAGQPFIDPEQMRRDFDPTTPTVVVDTRSPTVAAPAKADPVAAAQAAYNAMVARRGEAARAAVLGKIREQQESGVIPYTPENPQAVDAELRKRLGVTQGGQAVTVPRFINAGSVQTLQQRPTGGVVADYGDGNRVVTSRYGTATRAGPRKGEMTITEDGKTVSASQWFQKAADRQNRAVDMGEGGALYVPKARQAEFAEGARRLKAAEKASASKAKA